MTVSIVIDEEDEDTVSLLTTWMVQTADIVPSIAKVYCAKFVLEGVGSVRRLAKKVASDDSFLLRCNVSTDDASEISDALKKSTEAANR